MQTYWKKPWATLTLLGDARISREMPVFLENSPFTGSVKLNLRNKEAIKAVYLVVKGDVVTSASLPKRLNFLKLRQDVWKRTRAVRNSTGTSPGDDKLVGEYIWPFSIQLPEFTDDSAGENQYRLPHPFIERYSQIGVDYYLELHIHRNGKLQADDTLSVRFGYFTMQQPTGLSLPRLLAYQSNAMIPGPYVDPSGWKASNPVQIKGKAFGTRAVEVKCTIFLARPLCYTRGTAVPCSLTFESTDAQTADLFGALTSSALYLERCVTCFVDGTSSQRSSCGQARWWPCPPHYTPRNPNERYLMGELHLRKDLHPSSVVKQFRVDYAIVLFPPDAVAFTPADKFGPLLTQKVDIATRFPAGVRQQLSTPPAYEMSSPLVDRYYRGLSEVNLR
ncbi:hypothetical protein C8F01DRAFT_995908 [Mycena amicta]|nr:hypothetical protein C8F01DRAFT_995908 [Mycena amicta]